MPNNSYNATIEWLFEQFPSYQNIGASAYKPDLGNIRALCSFLGHPEKKLRFIHVAGTNGKGSVSSMLASIRTESGQKTGLFTSPHLIDIRERIRIDGKKITEAQVVNFCERIRQHPWNVSPSFFEITFAMALWHFLEQGTTLCVIETGLGGRLDATNIIQPLISVITNISLEHTQFLGNTLTSIAREKAGIIKQDTPVVIGESNNETASVFKEVSALNSSPLLDCTGLPEITEFQAPLLGDYQRTNLKIVINSLNVLRSMGIETTKDQIQNGLAKLHQHTGFTGRLQIIRNEPLTLLDVSHNEDGIRKTLDSVTKINRGKLYLIYGTSSDKEYEEIMTLFPKDALINYCTFRNQRSLSFDEFKKLNKKNNTEHPVYQDVKSALKEITQYAHAEDTILIFGSFFLIADFF